MYITRADLNASLYPEITQLISRYSDEVVLVKLLTAESLLETYLSARYAIRSELNKQGADRLELLVTLGVDVAIYELYAPLATTPEQRQRRYDRALKMLDLMAKGDILLPGIPPAPLPEQTTNAGQVGWGGNPRRPPLN